MDSEEELFVEVHQVKTPSSRMTTKAVLAFVAICAVLVCALVFLPNFALSVDEPAPKPSRQLDQHFHGPVTGVTENGDVWLLSGNGCPMILALRATALSIFISKSKSFVSSVQYWNCRSSSGPLRLDSKHAYTYEYADWSVVKAFSRRVIDTFNPRRLRVSFDGSCCGQIFAQGIRLQDVVSMANSSSHACIQNSLLCSPVHSKVMGCPACTRDTVNVTINEHSAPLIDDDANDYGHRMILIDVSPLLQKGFTIFRIWTLQENCSEGLTSFESADLVT